MAKKKLTTWQRLVSKYGVDEAKRRYDKKTKTEKKKRPVKIPSKKTKTKSTGGNKTTKRKKQSFGNWAKNVAVTGIATAPFWISALEANKQPSGKKLNYWGRRVWLYYTGEWRDENFVKRSQDTPKMALGWGSLGGAFVANEIASELQRKAPVKTLFPRFS